MFYLGLGIGVVLGAVTGLMVALRIFCLPIINRCDDQEAQVSKLKGEIAFSKTRIGDLECLMENVYADKAKTPQAYGPRY